MAKIKKGEVLTPLRGVTDTIVKGEGLIDLSTDKSGFTHNFVSLNIILQDEGELGNPDPKTYAEFTLSNDYDSLIEDGYEPHIASKISTATELLASALRSLIYRGGKYGTDI